MKSQDILNLSNDGARAYAPFRPADLQRLYDEAVEREQQDEPDPVRGHNIKEDAVVDLPF